MPPKYLQRDLDCLAFVQGGSVLYYGTRKRAEEEALVVLRYKIVGQCCDHIQSRIRALEKARTSAQQANNMTEIVTLSRLIDELRDMQPSLKSDVGDESTFQTLPEPRRKDLSQI